MKLNTRAVHAGDRKRTGSWVPVTTPIHTAASYFYDDAADLDRVFANEMPGPIYSRHGNPTNEALEELVTSLEAGAGALACSSGMAALHIAIIAALLDRRRVILAASALYGATINMLMKVLEPSGIETVFVDFCDEQAVAAAIAEHRPGALLMETISNPLLRVAPLDRIAAMAKEAGAQLIVDSTFATPLIVRPLELGAAFVVHSLTKYLSGHGDVLGGIIVTDAANIEAAAHAGALARPRARAVRVLSRHARHQDLSASHGAPVRQRLPARELARHASRIERVYFPADPHHPDAAIIKRLFAPEPLRRDREFRSEGRGPRRHLPHDECAPSDRARRPRSATCRPWCSIPRWRRTANFRRSTARGSASTIICCGFRPASKPWKTSSPISIRP